MTPHVNRQDAQSRALADLDPDATAAVLALAGDIALVVDESGIVRGVETATDDTSFEGVAGWVGQRLTNLVTAETRGKAEALIREALASGTARRRQLNHPNDSGVDVPVQYTAVRMGASRRVAIIGRDMRALASLQQKLVEAQQAMERDYWRMRHIETRYRLLFQMASEPILVLDSATLKVLEANTAAGHLFADSPHRLTGRTFPFRVEPRSRRALEEVLSNARATGRGGEARIRLEAEADEFTVSASCFRQDASTLLLVRFAPTSAGRSSGRSVVSTPPVSELVEQAPDGFVVTDLDGQILYANRAFLDIAQLTSEEQARGQLLGDWVGRPGADLPVFLTMLRKHGVVRLAQTAARGTHGAATEVEVSAVWIPDGELPCIGFQIRDVGRRLAAGPQGALDLTRAVEQLTGLVGRVSLRELVRDTVDLVERHFIEAALELTGDNRTSAAEVLGVSRQSLYVKLRRHHMLPASAAPGVEEPE